MTNNYTIILGAEGKLGRALAREVAGKGCNLILISTSRVDLQRFAIGLQLSKNVDVQAYRVNLSEHNEIVRIFSEIKSKYEIRALINHIACEWSDDKNECISYTGSTDFEARFRATAMLTWWMLPMLKKWPVAYIQNVVPAPGRAEKGEGEDGEIVSKLYAFSRELEEELKNSGVIVSVLHPMPLKAVPENPVFEDPYNPMVAMIPRRIAEKAINGMLAGNRLIIPGFRNWISFLFNRQTSLWFRLQLNPVIPREEWFFNGAIPSPQ